MLGKRSVKALRNLLHSLATGSKAYDAAYEDAMLRIEGQIDDQRELAKEALAFLTCTKHRFSKLDLEMALGAEFDNPKIDPDNFPDIDDIVTACAGLVTINDESDTVGLAHYTTQEYLERTQQRWFPHAQALITNACLSYLSFPSSPLSQDDWAVGLGETWASHDWCTYSVKNWGHHASQVPDSHGRVMAVLNQATDSRSSIGFLYHELTGNWILWPHIEIDESLLEGLHLAAYFGLEAAFVALLKQAVDQSLEFNGKDPSLTTALAIATYYGHEAIVRQLLLHGVSIEPSIHSPHSNGSATVMHLAAMRGHSIVLKLFLDHGADVNLRNLEGKTALHFAVACGSVPATMVLLEAQANVNICDEWGQTPLHKAAANKSGNLAIVQQLIKHGAAIDLCDDVGDTVLHHALTGGSILCIKLLVEAQTDVNAANIQGMTPLHRAAARDDATILKCLLDLGASVEQTTKTGFTVLMSACLLGSHFQEKLEILLAAGADLHALDCYNHSVLVWAMYLEPRPDLLRFLLEQGADPKLGVSPLSYAVSQFAEDKTSTFPSRQDSVGGSINSLESGGYDSDRTFAGHTVENFEGINKQAKEEWLVRKRNWEACIQILKEFGAE